MINYPQTLPKAKGLRQRSKEKYPSIGFSMIDRWSNGCYVCDVWGGVYY